MPHDDEPPRSRLSAGPGVPPARRGHAEEPWELVLADDLNDKSGELLEKLVEVPRRSRGTVWFDSPGGSVYSGLAVATTIRLRGLRATGIVAGECSSAALLPLAACERRVVTPHSTLLFHPIRWTGEEDMRMEDAAEWARHFAELEPSIDELTARLFGCDVEQIRRWNRPGKFVSGQELVDAGLATMVSLDARDVWSQLA